VRTSNDNDLRPSIISEKINLNSGEVKMLRCLIGALSFSMSLIPAAAQSIENYSEAAPRFILIPLRANFQGGSTALTVFSAFVVDRKDGGVQFCQSRHTWNGSDIKTVCQEKKDSIPGNGVMHIYPAKPPASQTDGVNAFWQLNWATGQLKLCSQNTQGGSVINCG
jgi:hypothetical protein